MWRRLQDWLTQHFIAMDSAEWLALENSSFRELSGITPPPPPRSLDPWLVEPAAAAKILVRRGLLLPSFGVRTS